MKILLIIALIAALAAGATWILAGREKPRHAGSRTSIYDAAFTAIEGNRVSLSAFRGKHLLIVNVASQCGFTPQYAELERLSETYRDRLVVLGFPANDFMGQEPGSNEEIKAFCSTRFGVTFPLSEKVSVVGDGRADVFRWLTDSGLNGWNDAAPKWNFTKYLVGPDGELLKVFPPTTAPMSAEITEALR